MDFRKLTTEDKQRYRSDIIEMMKKSDKDFIPPLSARTSTLQKDWSAAAPSEDGLMLYYEELNKQEILGAFEGDELLGFVSFKENYTNDTIKEEGLPNIYLSTLVLKPEAKGKGLTVRMYDFLFLQCYGDRNIYTRTWSTNIAHMKILSKFAFDELARMKDDRGEGIDTVYYVKKQV